MTTLKTLTIAGALLVSGASLAMAQSGLPTGGQRPVAGGANGGGWYGGYPGYGYGYGYSAAPLYDYATPVADLAPPGYGYAPAPVYAAPAYAAPATAGTTVIIVTPAPAYAAPAPLYAAPPVTTGYYAAPPIPPAPIPEPIYDYAPGYHGYGWR